MDSLLIKGAWGKTAEDYSEDSFKRLQLEHIAYLELEKHPAWSSYCYRLDRMLKTMRRQLELGTVDKFNVNHDDEKRAVIHTIETLLTYPATIHREYEREQSRRTAEEERRQADTNGPIHGSDIPGPSLNEFLNT